MNKEKCQVIAWSNISTETLILLYCNEFLCDCRHKEILEGGEKHTANHVEVIFKKHLLTFILLLYLLLWVVLTIMLKLLTMFRLISKVKTLKFQLMMKKLNNIMGIVKIGHIGLQLPFLMENVMILKFMLHILTTRL